MEYHSSALIASCTQSGNSLLYQLQIPEDLIYFKGHFDDFALLPGVVQVKWACELAEPIVPSMSSKDISKLKFMSPILPGEKIALSLEIKKPGTLNFVYRKGEQECSRGTIHYDC